MNWCDRWNRSPYLIDFYISTLEVGKRSKKLIVLLQHLSPIQGFCELPGDDMLRPASALSSCPPTHDLIPISRPVALLSEPTQPQGLSLDHLRNFSWKEFPSKMLTEFINVLGSVYTCVCTCTCMHRNLKCNIRHFYFYDYFNDLDISLFS